ncbi:DUF3899 domain-containing protein [Loigolactobacillus binensis]|uniref:DUF3899 domain-containing protein n=1 Tax=Loigolactobacillus binensis TaxID=2559922 RepID=A0ABW3EDK8_9LACO|nr:DUF3899 domain-containing protein [Loigolactobacillus binensis]
MVKKISLVSLAISLIFALLLSFLSDKETFLLSLSNNLFLIGLFVLIIAIILYLYDAHLFQHLSLHQRRKNDAPAQPTSGEQAAFYTELRRAFLWIGLGELIASIVISFL